VDLLLAAEYQPFVVAGLVMAGLVLIETASLAVGFSLSAIVDKGFDLEGGGHDSAWDLGVLGGLLGWVNAGRVPVLVFIITWLAAFAAAGFIIQTAAIGLWTALPALAASLAAFLLANPATRIATRAVARLIPAEETYVVSHDELVGRVGEVTLGPLDGGLAGRVKVRDLHGNLHFPMARPAQDGAPIPVGAQVLLVDRQGMTFLVIPAPEDLKPAP
jgi:Protein of unknown function (DUF1449)